MDKLEPSPLVNEEKPMFTFSHSIFIDRPVEDVWAYVSDVTNHPEFGPSLTSEWTSEGPPGVGSTYRSTSRFLGRTVDSTSEITSWNPLHQFTNKLKARIHLVVGKIYGYQI